MTQRYKSIDIVKALLIFGVVYFHMWTILRGSCGLTHPGFDLMYSFHKCYCMFFMPAFFIIVGYCSNFDRPFVNFLVVNIKRILIPMVTLNVIPCLLSHNKEALLYLMSLENWLWGLSFWFLPVLFLSKLMYWPINRFLSESKYSLFIVLILFVLSVVLTQYKIGTNYWYWKSALADLSFIWFGRFFRNIRNKRFWTLCSLLYVPLVLLWIIFDWDRPNVGLSVHCTFPQIPLLFLMAVSGTLCTFGLAKLIGKSLFLEYVGKASLVIYCSHWFIGQHLGIFLSKFLPLNNKIEACSFYLLVVTITVFLCCVFNWLLNLKYCRSLLGKF